MRRSADVNLLEHAMVANAKRVLMDVVIELNRVDQRLADIAEWIPLHDPVPHWVPETLAEHFCSAIKMIRGEYLGEVILLLRSAAEQTHLSLWLDFKQQQEEEGE